MKDRVYVPVQFTNEITSHLYYSKPNFNSSLVKTLHFSQDLAELQGLISGTRFESIQSNTFDGIQYFDGRLSMTGLERLQGPGSHRPTTVGPGLVLY